MLSSGVDDSVLGGEIQVCSCSLYRTPQRGRGDGCRVNKEKYLEDGGRLG